MRLFIALEIERGVLEGLAPVFDLLSRQSSILKAVPPDNCHITLKFLGECRAGLADDIIREFDTIQHPEGAISYKLRGLGAFPDLTRASVLWCGVETEGDLLADLFSGVESFAGRFGFSREKRKFFPHLTLARVKKGMGLTSLVADYFKERSEIEFAASSFTRLSLFASMLTPRGSVYRVLKDIHLPEK